MLTAVLLCLGVLTQADSLLDEEEFSSTLPVERTLLPPAFRLAPAQSVDRFFDDSAALREDVDELTQDKP